MIIQDGGLICTETLRTQMLLSMAYCQGRQLIVLPIGVIHLFYW